MTLESEFGIIYSRKRIPRVIRKFNVVCSIRKVNLYKRMAKAIKEHMGAPNILNREFKEEVVRKVLLIDIAYFSYGKGQMGYLSTIKDASTNEILAYNLSDSLKLDIATDTIHKLMANTNVKLLEYGFIHSDQGAHYTSPAFQKTVKV